MSHLTDERIREILRPHRDGGPISRLYATGEITTDTVPALGMHAHLLEEEGEHEAADQVDDVLLYAQAVGERPPVDGWTAKL